MQQLNFIIVTFLFVALFSCGIKSARQSSPVSQKPNILLIMADDLGWSDIGCYGSEVATPNLDKLAGEGIRFTQFHNTSKCHPSRASLLTGLYAQQVGYNVKFNQPLQNGITLGEYLKSAGYLTLMSGKHHGVENPYTRGFDRYYGLKDGACNHFNPGKQRPGEGKPAQKKADRNWCIDDKEYAPYSPEEKDFYTTDYFTKYALNWLDEYINDERPFFLYMAYTAPHDPLMAWPEDITKYKGKYKEGYEAIRKSRFAKQKKTGLIDAAYQLSEPTHKPWNSLSAQEKKVEEEKMEVYAAMIDRLDQNIGRIIRKLKQQGKYDNTLIIFLSDNGASGEVVELDGGYGPIGSMTNWVSLGEDWANVGNTPFRYFKNYSYEGGTASPFIVSWKNGLKNPARVSHFTGHLIDIMATFVDVAGAPYPNTYKDKAVLPYEGVSLLPVIRNENVARQKPVFWEWQRGRAVRDGKWKIVKHGLDMPWSLFDMVNDPSETKDLAKTYPDVTAKMNTMFEEWKKRVTIKN